MQPFLFRARARAVTALARASNALRRLRILLSYRLANTPPMAEEEVLLRQAVSYWGEALMAVSYALGVQQHVAEDVRASVRFLHAREERVRSAQAAEPAVEPTGRRGRATERAAQPAPAPAPLALPPLPQLAPAGRRGALSLAGLLDAAAPSVPAPSPAARAFQARLSSARLRGASESAGGTSGAVPPAALAAALGWVRESLEGGSEWSPQLLSERGSSARELCVAARTVAHCIRCVSGAA